MQLSVTICDFCKRETNKTMGSIVIQKPLQHDSEGWVKSIEKTNGDICEDCAESLSKTINNKPILKIDKHEEPVFRGSER